MRSSEIRRLAALALALSFGLATIAAAQTTGSTRVDISLPSMVVLQYFSEVDVSIDGNTLQTWLGATANVGTTSGSAGVDGTSLQLDADISSEGDFAPTNDPAAAALVLLNAWAVRSLAADGESTQVSIVVTEDTLSHAEGASITISSAGVRASGGGAFGGSTSFAPPGLKSPTLGDVRLVLDLTGATLAGAYTHGEYTLTVQNL